MISATMQANEKGIRRKCRLGLVTCQTVGIGHCLTIYLTVCVHVGSHEETIGWSRITLSTVGLRITDLHCIIVTRLRLLARVIIPRATYPLYHVKRETRVVGQGLEPRACTQLEGFDSSERTSQNVVRREDPPFVSRHWQH